LALDFFGTFFLELTRIITSIGGKTTYDGNTEGRPKISNTVVDALVADLAESPLIQAISSDVEQAKNHAGLIIIPALAAREVC
jgi:hypothetical protein